MGYIGNKPTAVPLTSADIQDGVITAADLGANFVDSSELLDGSIDTSHIGAAQVTADKTSGVVRPNAQNLIINSDMAVAQRGTSTASIAGGTNDYYTCDRWSFIVDTDSSVWTQSQDTDVPSGYGFANSLKLDCTTLDASPSYLLLQQKIEGQDLQLLKKGTANAEKLTLAFWVKSVKTGTYICELKDCDNNRTVSQAYTVDSGSTWEKKILNFPADTTGALDDDNAVSLEVTFFLALSSVYTSGTLATSWESRTNANRGVGQVNLSDSTSNNFWLTAVQLEVGEYTSTTIPPFQHESYGDNYDRCLRYYYRITPVSGLRFVGWCQMDNDDTNHVAYIDFKKNLRVPPTALEQSGTASHYKIREGTTTTCDAVPTFNQADIWYSQISFKKSSSGFSQGELNKCGIDGSSGYLGWSAEL